MKKIKNLILLGLTVILFTACQNNQPEHYTRISPEIDVVKALVKDYHEGNWEAWLTHYADTAKIYHNTWKDGVSAKETAESLKVILSNTSSYGFEVEENLPWYEMVTNDNGNIWVYFWGNWKGTLEANSKELEIPVHLALRFVDGKIAREEGFYNLSEFTAALQEIEAAKMTDEEATTE
ncbi:MAG: nuclear transport factor 2 family protein [Bacteroidetes bacterium]|nr:MAG: nuclear transport factor 2 family protein [Bacteroidota bacterium]